MDINVFKKGRVEDSNIDIVNSENNINDSSIHLLNFIQDEKNGY